jgi:tyrosinase
VNTFPPWHRPYVALYEQLLASFFPTIVSEYAQSNPSLGQQLQTASQTWRLPYWDWAINQTIPAEWTADTVQILDTNGNVTNVTNPFAQYAFHPIDDSFAPYVPPNSPDFANWPTTLRQPTDPSDPNATSQPSVCNSQLATSDFKALILDLFPSQLFEPDPWGQFSNHSWDSIHRGQPTLTSLEGIHDTIHVDVGGYGHMGDPTVAAFDPIFWLHHCNVDRLLALWQAAYPNVYVSPGPDMSGIPLLA